MDGRFGERLVVIIGAGCRNWGRVVYDGASLVCRHRIGSLVGIGVDVFRNRSCWFGRRLAGIAGHFQDATPGFVESLETGLQRRYIPNANRRRESKLHMYTCESKTVFFSGAAG